MRKVLYILGHLNDEDIEWLARKGVRRKIHKGDILIHQDKQTEALFVVLEGQLTVSVKNIGDVAEIKVGEIVGEISFVDSRPAYATIIAGGEALVLAVKKDLLQDKLDRDIAFGARFYKALSIFLADRMRERVVQRIAYGAKAGLDAEEELEDEIPLHVLDSLTIAGTRFDRMLKILMGASSGS